MWSPPQAAAVALLAEDDSLLLHCSPKHTSPQCICTLAIYKEMFIDALFIEHYAHLNYFKISEKNRSN
jgi:hypothetical protein